MKTKIIVLLFIIFTFSTCKKDHLLDCFKSAGKTITENRETNAFININLTDNVDLIIHTDTTYFVKVTAGDNLINGIITERNNNTLYIRNENRCNWMRSFKNIYTVEIGMNQPELIHYNGSGNITCLDTIRKEDFIFDSFGGSGTINLNFNSNKIHLNDHIGRADIHAFGFANESYIYVNDVGVLDASGMNTNYTYITNNSTGDCRINVKNELGFEIKYSGNIFYTGNPHILSQNFSGTGKLIHY